MNKACILPFTFNGHTHTKCPVDPENPAKYWCSTKTDGRGNHVIGQQEYGHCSKSSCPLESKSSTTNPPVPLIRSTCSGSTRCKSFVECSSKYRTSRGAKRCTLGDGGLGICCKNLNNNNGKILHYLTTFYLLFKCLYFSTCI